jgi:formylglycine-generating enzyme required for sulfatase activity
MRVTGTSRDRGAGWRHSAFGLFVVLAAGFLGTAANAQSRGISVELRTAQTTDAPVLETVKLYANSHALVIGIDAYKGGTKGWPRLSNAVRDAEQVAVALTAKGFQVTLLKNLDSNALESRLEDFFIDKGDDPEARLFVWFAGHGHTERGLGYLVPADAPLPQKDGRGFKRKALSMRQFGVYVRQARSKHVYTVFDSCFSGTIFEGARATPPVAITRATALPVRQFLSSGDTNQTVSDDGTFRELFLDALAGRRRADANGDGYLTASELGLFMTDRMINYTNDAQTPKYGKLRDKDWDRGDFVFKLASLTPANQRAGIGLADRETAYWKSVESLDSADAYRLYLKNYPTGDYADLARLKVASLAPVAPAPSFQVTALDQTMVVSGAAKLNIRGVPGGPKVGGLKTGDQVEVTGKIEHEGALWYRVAVAGGGAGFVFGKYLADKPLTAVKPAVGVYPKPSALAPGAVFQDCPDCPEMVVVPPGDFMMGSPKSEADRSDNEGPVHRVKILAAFAVSKYEVTFDAFDACVSAGGCSHKLGDQGWGRGRRPVINVNWGDAQEYVSWLSKKTGKTYRLLSEAEWEYVARAGTETPFHTGKRITTDQANFNGNATYIGWSKGAYRKQTVPVGSFGANQFGLHDVHGNVWEWVKDCWNGSYDGAPIDGSTWTAGDCTNRVLRGGSWLNAPRDFRSASRIESRTDDRNILIGFRIARTFAR